VVARPLAERIGISHWVDAKGAVRIDWVVDEVLLNVSADEEPWGIIFDGPEVVKEQAIPSSGTQAL
jgi:hypothetical protein